MSYPWETSTGRMLKKATDDKKNVFQCKVMPFQGDKSLFFAHGRQCFAC